MNEIILFFESNYSWLIPSFVGLLLAVITFFKKGSITKADTEKIMTAISIIGSATSLLMEKEAKKTNEKVSSTKESEKVSQD